MTIVITEAKTREDLMLMYDFVGVFTQDGLAVARKGDDWFHIKQDGTPAYKEKYRGVRPFINGVAEVFVGTKKFRIRPDGSTAD